MDNKNHSISVIIPACNEEQGIERAILHNIRTFQTLNLDFETIVIDDKSVDRTRDIVESLADRFPTIRVLRHEKNMGSGAAFKTGIANATKSHIIFAPVDNPLDVEDMKAYLSRLDVCDIVVGFRMERVGYSAFARFASFVYNRIFIPLLFNIGLSDVNWISIYRTNLFKDDVISFNSTSLFWLVEILIRARRKHLIIAEVPGRMKKRMHGRATCTRPSVILRTFTEMLKFFWMIQKEDKNK